MGGDKRQRIDSIAVVGGGDAGLMAALALEKGLNDPEIVVIDDFDETIPEVGKSTLRYIVNFLHEELEISQTRLVSEVKLGWKSSVYFKDWCGRELHSPLGKPLPTMTQVEVGKTVEPLARSESLTPENEAVFDEFYYRYQEDEFMTLYNELAETPGKTPLILDEKDINDVQKGLPDAAYHFDHRSFNQFLRTIARSAASPSSTTGSRRSKPMETISSRSPARAKPTPQISTSTPRDSAAS